MPPQHDQQILITPLQTALSLQRSFILPAANITEVSECADPWAAIQGIRTRGVMLPGRMAVGTWRGTGWTDFIAITRRNPGWIIELRGPKYRRAIVTSDHLAKSPETAQMSTPE